MENDIDNTTQLDYLKNKMLNERYPTYQYYMAIKQVADSIFPEPEYKYLKLLNIE